MGIVSNYSASGGGKGWRIYAQTYQESQKTDDQLVVMIFHATGGTEANDNRSSRVFKINQMGKPIYNQWRHVAFTFNVNNASSRGGLRTFIDGALYNIQYKCYRTVQILMGIAH